MDVILSEQDVVQPDLVILRSTRDHLVSDRGIEGAPDILVELLSPGTVALDRRAKQAAYARFGVPEYWLVEPVAGHVELYRQSAELYVLERRFDKTSRLTTPSFKEVDVDLAQVFRP